MILPPLKINKNIQAEKPIIQGGMAIRVSTAKLAAAVANCGGVGVIAASGLPEQELRSQIRLAKELNHNPNGLLAVNIMYAAAEFTRLVEISIEEKIDLIIFGAGFSRDIFSIGREANVPVVPIVSSPKLAVMSKKLGATCIIVESGEAGGHLGTCESTRNLIPAVKKALDETPNHKDIDEISIVAAGGITSGADIVDIMELGANGVQMGTRFVLSKECEVHDNFKQLYLNSTEEDIVMIKSPVGLPARAIKTSFSKNILACCPAKPNTCDLCLKHCSHDFCIISALEKARKGNMEEGLFFTGSKVKSFNDIISVKEIFERLESQAKEYIESKKAKN